MNRSIVARAMSFGLCLASAAHLLPAQQSVRRVSVDSAGSQSNASSCDLSPPAISADARYVAFDSWASNLVLADNNQVPDVFVHDRVTGATVRVSIDSAGIEANGGSYWPSLSSDGRFVSFYSFASNLVAGDGNGVTDVFVQDRDPDGNGIFDEGNGVTTRVSVDSSGVEGNHRSRYSSISGDGRLVAFDSDAGNLVGSDSNHVSDVFVHDRVSGTTTRASLDSAGGQGDGGSYWPAISQDGSTVAFMSQATDLVASDTNGSIDVFVRDRVLKQTTRASVDSFGAEGDADSLSLPGISSDGSVVAFASWADNLVAGDANGEKDVFLRDRKASATTRVSVDTSGIEGNQPSDWPALSKDGLTVAFKSKATNLVVDDANAREDVFVHERTTANTILVSTSCSAAPADQDSDKPAINGDGKVVAFPSFATDLVTGDTNAVEDVFARDRTLDLDAKWSNYGAGYAGTNGIPSLTSSADPAFGSSISIDVGNSLGATTAGVLLVGTSRASIPTTRGGTLLVNVALLVPVAIPAGGLSLPGTIPHDDALCGVILDLQAVELDAGAQFGLSFTPGLELVFGQ